MADTPAKELEAAVRDAIQAIGDGSAGAARSVLSAALARWEAPGGEREGWGELSETSRRVMSFLGRAQHGRTGAGEDMETYRRQIDDTLARLRGAK